ncbi:MAG: polysaccharide pyruvyl transferase family protein [Roseovarius sp.]|nr:polysaccharide pyruvyl transferase family protein [Roseovarius sp.]
MIFHVFRADPNNVGDWWCAPFRFIDFGSPSGVCDIMTIEELPNSEGLVVVGGGGLGRDNFIPFFKKLFREDRLYKVIAWGVGADSLTTKKSIQKAPSDMRRLTSYFDECDILGTRIHPSTIPGGCYAKPHKTHWVPCVSCMSPLFDELRKVPPRASIGLYEHRRVTISGHVTKWPHFLAKYFGPFPINSNEGKNLREKLEYLSSFDTIITNSYHGVYWSLLLGRKCICVPFKNGLFSFRHSPSYLTDGDLKGAIDRAQIYPDMLEECRAANMSFLEKIKSEFSCPAKVLSDCGVIR